MNGSKTDLSLRFTPVLVIGLILMLIGATLMNGAQVSGAAASLSATAALSVSNGCAGANFSQPISSPVNAGNSPASVATGDFNLDGKPDMATANSGSNNVTIQLGDGSGGFTQPVSSPIAVGNNPRSVVVADFNLDGKPDLATANLSSNNVTILLGNGSGGFTQPVSSPIAIGGFLISVSVGDFNLDGKPDLATANVLLNSVTILLGDGSGGFTQPAGSPVAVGNSPNSVAIADFNQDGKPDMAVANYNSNNLTILLGNGNGSFTQSASSPVGVVLNPIALSVGDFNQDGKLDLATANDGSNNVTLLSGNGSGGFTQAAGSPVGVGSRPQSIVVADFNLDGKPDLVTANLNSNNATILLSNGSSGFTEPVGSPVATGAHPQSVAVADFNLDGKPDFATANFNSNNVTIQLNTCDALPCVGADFTQPAGSPIGLGFSPFCVASGDFNQDGKLDLVTSNPNSQNLSILLGNGSGGFTQPAGSPVGTGVGPRSVTVGDFNGDGRLDLATANPVTANVTILLGNGSGGFIPSANFFVGKETSPASIAVGDFNRDGNLDLATANFGAENVTVLLGDGLGGFAESAGSPVSVGAGPLFVAVGDFNRDSKADLVTVNFSSSDLSIRLGDGSGGFTFPAGSPVGVGPRPQSVAVGDFNQDGKPDLAVANNFSASLTILLGNGSGGFTRPPGSPVGAGSFPISVATGDFNRDGKADLAVTNGGSNTVTLLLGNGSGGFTQSAGPPVGTGTAPVFLAVGDFNHDSKPDFAVANQASQDVTIQLNTCSSDTTPPQISCPANQTAVTAVCGGTSQALNYPAPTASDNLPGVTTVCSPASGSIFPLGTTTVTCTATDTSGNTATCSFTVTLFNACIQDDANPGRVLLWNTQTGAYRFCCNGTTFAGIGSVNNRGSSYTLTHNASGRKVSGNLDCSMTRGSGSLQPIGGAVCSISDRDIRNNSCACQ
jgi:hypothetical protein